MDCFLKLRSYSQSQRFTRKQDYIKEQVGCGAGETLANLQSHWVREGQALVRRLPLSSSQQVTSKGRSCPLLPGRSSYQNSGFSCKSSQFLKMLALNSKCLTNYTVWAKKNRPKSQTAANSPLASPRIP